MRGIAAVSAILAASTATQAVIATGPSKNTTVTLVPPPLSTGHSVPSQHSRPPVHGNTTIVVPSVSVPFPTPSGSPPASSILPGNFTGIRTTVSALPPIPTASNTGVPPIPIAGATTNAQNSLLAMGVAMVMAALML